MIIQRLGGTATHSNKSYHHVPNLLPRFNIPVRIHDLLQRIIPVDNRLNFPVFTNPFKNKTSCLLVVGIGNSTFFLPRHGVVNARKEISESGPSSVERFALLHNQDSLRNAAVFRFNAYRVNTL